MGNNGIWRVELLGQYGWEAIATAFLEDGRYRAGSENHYTIGSYKVSGNRIEISATTEQYGKVRTVFGEKDRELDLVLEGEIKGDEIIVQAMNDKGASKISLKYTRLADLP